MKMEMPANQNVERMVDEYGDALLRMCYLYLKDYHLAEDAVQETFIKAIKSYDSFKQKSSEKTWITRIAINTCKNIMRNHWFQMVQDNIDMHITAIKGNPIDDFQDFYFRLYGNRFFLLCLEYHRIGQIYV